jgi:hypothetical protein
MVDCQVQGAGRRGLFQEAIRLAMGGEQVLDAAAQVVVAGAGLCQPLVPLGGRNLAEFDEDLLGLWTAGAHDTLPTAGRLQETMRRGARNRPEEYREIP